MKQCDTESHSPLAARHSSSPTHVAIIMDGNGRWAKARGLPRTAGHKKGADALRATLEACRETGVSCLTVYAFSAENWKRPQEEIGELMQLLKFYLNREIGHLYENGIRLRFIGDRSRLSTDIIELMRYGEEKTKANGAFTLTVALSYGSRQEIVRAAQALARRVAAGELTTDVLTESAFEQMLDTQGLPEPDLLIRTGGEKRLSNFLLWQSAYTELYFTDTLWPDFSREDLFAAMQEFSRRERRYGNAN